MSPDKKKQVIRTAGPGHESKSCATGGREIYLRKNWERNWDEVK